MSSKKIYNVFKKPELSMSMAEKEKVNESLV